MDNHYHYHLVERAIQLISEKHQEQPSLNEIASEVNMSPFHFQRVFSEWAGVSPKKFLQYISLQHARKLIDRQKTLFDTSVETGLSGSGRLHDLFVSIEAMTPGEYRNGGGNLTISYSFSVSPYGETITASTNKGICHLAFTDGKRTETLEELRGRFPRANYTEREEALHKEVSALFRNSNPKELKLHIKGTPFQLKVWEALLRIPEGELAVYADIADQAGNKMAHRAAGTAIGKNPVAWIIPCHRVIASSGILGNYRWGKNRKAAIIGREMAKTHLACNSGQTKS
jgi:AraC family transcriptional regulator, regulatory protein of adaptative response / methylated-DNA-[protein]-cysteine methyltransferase